MKNAINYYYNLKAESIHQQDNKYKFTTNLKQYLLCKYDGKIEELEEKYYLQQYLNIKQIYCHRIIKNKYNQLITKINLKKYVLIELIFNNRIINLKDISLLSNINVDKNSFKYINKDEWKDLWKRKIDYIEYQINQLGKKYNIIIESNDYFIGIVENCIELIENEKIKSNNCTICHERIEEKTNTDDFYNPVNFIIDDKTRDIAEYIKKTLYKEQCNNKNLINYIMINNLYRNEILLLFARIMYPSIYFDSYEQILAKKIEEKELLKIINNLHNFENNIISLYNELKQITDMPNIEWLVFKEY